MMMMMKMIIYLLIMECTYSTDECGPDLIMEDDDDDDIPVDDWVDSTNECGPGLIMEGDDDGGGR